MVIPTLQLLATFITLFIYRRKFGWQPSISEHIYLLKDKDNIRGFDILLIGVLAVPLFLYERVGFKESTQFILAIAAFFLFMVPIAGFFRSDKVTSTLHYIGATGAIVLGMIALCVEYGSVLPLLGILGSIPLYFVKNKTYWIEVYYIAYIYGGFIVSRL